MKKFREFVARLRSTLLILVLAVGQVVGAAGPFMQLQTANAAPICVTDTAGANDEPGQKDLTKLCVDYAGVPTTVATTWNWDDLGTSGANTMDACNLFDTDGDGNINYSVCVTTQNTPATLQTLTTYSCGDDKIDRCTSPATVVPNGATSCSVSQQATDPFAAGNGYPTDTQGSCTIQLSTVGGATAKLVDVCSYPSAQPNSDPSDCVIAREDFGKVELIKDLIPGTDPGLFNLTINGPEASDTTTVNNVGDGGTTGEVVVKKGSVVVSETAGTSTLLSSYNTGIVCRDLNGTGAALTLTSTDLTGTTRQATFTLAEDADVVCTITNTRQNANIQVVKDVINDNGGTKTYADFTFQVNGGSEQTFLATTSPDGARTISVPIGTTYTITEPQANSGGYTTTYSNCTSITPVVGQTQVCTITNDDIAPQLTVTKHVVNDNGGAAVAGDFTMNVTATDPSDASFPGDESGTTITLDAGSYSVDEDAFTGYTKTLGTDCSGSIAISEHKYCTITNDDQPVILTLIKLLPNDNGGTATEDDFSVYIDGLLAQWGANNLDAGSYTVSEDTLPGYLASDWGTDCDAQGNIILMPGQSLICTITNDDEEPSLTLVKEVTNDNGGTADASDWTLTATGPTGFSGAGPSVSNGASFDAGTYDLSESGPDGYTASDWVCVGGTQNDADTITVGLGQDATCTITNNDNTPILHLRKVVVNDNGGSATLADFTLTANGAGSNDISGTSPVDSDATLDADTFALSETGPTGYTASDWVCVGGTQNGANITLGLGQEATCTITNNDNAPSLTLIKEVVNDNGGTADASDWTLTATGPTGFSGVGPSVSNGASFDSGTYDLSESGGTDGYTASDWVCVGGTQDDSNTVTLGLGESATCTITNDDQAPSLTLVKEVVNDNSGTAEPSDWTLTADPTAGDTISGNGAVTENDAQANTPYSLSEDGPDGYFVKTDWNCTGTGGTFDANANTITLALSADVTCTIVNDDDTNPGIHVEKTGPDAANPGDTVTYTFTVTNTGDAPLDITTVNDNVAGDGVYQSGDTNDNSLLDLTETWIYTADYIIPADQDSNIRNTVTVCGEDSREKEVCDTDRHKLKIYAKVIVTKYNDYNRNGKYDPGETELPEPTLPGWDFTLTHQEECYDLPSLLSSFVSLDYGCDEFESSVTQTTGADGTTTFVNVLPKKSYELSETLKDGWHQSNIYCGGEDRYEGQLVDENSYFIYPYPGETIECFVGNYQDLLLLIEKSNNKPNPTDVGDTVTYTIKVTVPENSGPSYNTTVTDLPPEGFTYVPGSWTANSSVRGNLKPGTTTEPTYASPGLWQLGNLLPGEVVTLTYQALITSTVSPGTYPDLAYTVGCETPTSDCEVLGNVSAGASTPFVGTKVAIKSPQVLAATILVNTGVSDLWRTSMAATLLIGLALATIVRREKKGGRA